MAILRPGLAVLAAALALCACQPGPGPDASADDGAMNPGVSPVLLAVTGAGGRQPVEGGLFERFAVGGAAHTFSAADIARLPHHRIETGFPLGENARVWQGVRLGDVLAAAGAPGAGARLTCLDGYQIEVSAALIAAHQPVLARSVDGQALVLGELGPFILVWPRGSAPELSDMPDDLWAFGVFAIKAI